VRNEALHIVAVKIFAQNVAYGIGDYDVGLQLLQSEHIPRSEALDRPCKSVGTKMEAGSDERRIPLQVLIEAAYRSIGHSLVTHETDEDY
jgi:hypothetical protein